MCCRGETDRLYFHVSCSLTVRKECLDRNDTKILRVTGFVTQRHRTKEGKEYQRLVIKSEILPETSDRNTVSMRMIPPKRAELQTSFFRLL
jgi:hypothetical protein